MAEQRQIDVYGISGQLASLQLLAPVYVVDLQLAIKQELGVRVRDQRLYRQCAPMLPSDVLAEDCGLVTLLRAPRRCSVCGRRYRVRKCAACLSVYYCGPLCQRLDWRRHKREDSCKRRGRALAAHAEDVRATTADRSEATNRREDPSVTMVPAPTSARDGC